MRKTNLLFLSAIITASLGAQQASIESYGRQVMNFFREKNQALLEMTLDNLSSILAMGGHDQKIFLVFHAQLFKENSWKERFMVVAQGRDSHELQSFLKGVEEVDLDAIFNSQAPTGFENDYLWACFFATGDMVFVDRLLEIAEAYSLERKDINLFMAGITAAWSLSSNANQFPEVGQHLEQRFEETNSELVRLLLDKSPGEWRNSMYNVLQIQKQAGIW